MNENEFKKHTEDCIKSQRIETSIVIKVFNQIMFDMVDADLKNEEYEKVDV